MTLACVSETYLQTWLMMVVVESSEGGWWCVGQVVCWVMVVVRSVVVRESNLEALRWLEVRVSVA